MTASLPPPPKLELRAASGIVRFTLMVLLLVPAVLVASAVVLAVMTNWSDTGLCLAAAAIVGGLLLMALSERTTADPNGIVIRRYGRTRRLSWDQVAEVYVAREGKRPRALVATLMDGTDIDLVERETDVVRAKDEARTAGSPLDDLRVAVLALRPSIAATALPTAPIAPLAYRAEPVEWHNPRWPTAALQLLLVSAFVAVVNGVAVMWAATGLVVAVGLVWFIAVEVLHLYRRRPGRTLLAADREGVRWYDPKQHVVAWRDVATVRVSGNRRREVLLLRTDGEATVLPLPLPRAVHPADVAAELLRRRPPG